MIPRDYGGTKTSAWSPLPGTGTPEYYRLRTDPIPDEYAEKIIEAACPASSGANSQLWEFTVLKYKATSHRIVE
ncbi:MAG: nitroreductase family protein [Syntrophorhabdales bacterium]|jgi:nitroreductase